MTKDKKYFKINIDDSKLKEGIDFKANINENSGGNMSITLGQPYIPERIPNQHEKITIIDHKHADIDSDGGFLSKRFHNK